MKDSLRVKGTDEGQFGTYAGHMQNGTPSWVEICMMPHGTYICSRTFENIHNLGEVVVMTSAIEHLEFFSQSLFIHTVALLFLCTHPPQPY